MPTIWVISIWVNFSQKTKSRLTKILVFGNIVLALRKRKTCASGSVGGARPCQGRGRGFESRLALFSFHEKRTSGRMSFFRESKARQGSASASGYRGLSPRKVGFGRCRAGVHRTPCIVSHSKTTYGNKQNCD